MQILLSRVYPSMQEEHSFGLPVQLAQGDSQGVQFTTWFCKFQSKDPIWWGTNPTLQLMQSSELMQRAQSAGQTSH